MRIDPTFLQATLSFIDDRFQECPDLIKKKILLKKDHEAFFIYLDGIADSNIIQRDFIGPILLMDDRELTKEESLINLPPAKLRFYRDSDTVVKAILSGEVVFLSECIEYCIAAGMECKDLNFNLPPKGEHSIFAPSKSFQDKLSNNLALLRGSIKTSHLKFRILESETVLKNKIAIAYIKGIADPSLLHEVTRRVQAIINDGDINGQFERALKDFRFSPFPEFQYTKRSDLTVAALYEGRIAILREENPVIILAPTNFFNFFHSPDDDHTHWIFASGMRFVRIIATLMVVTLPGLYIAFSTFHYQFLNLDLIITLAQSRVKVPFLPFVEVVIMEIFLAVIYELCFRLSNNTVMIGIIGSLIIGGTLLTTGMISNVLLIISALSIMATLLIPIYHVETIQLLRCQFILFAGLLGMLGIAISASLTFAHLIIITSMGQPYLQPFIPFQFRKALSSILSVPYHYLFKEKARTYEDKDHQE